MNEKREIERWVGRDGGGGERERERGRGMIKQRKRLQRGERKMGETEWVRERKMGETEWVETGDR